mgnify:CR=1 FL=1
MQGINLKRYIFLLLFFITFVNASNTREVLLLHSYHKGYKWSDDISTAIETKFSPYKNINLTTVYMDTKKIATPTYLDKLARLYKEQFEKRDFDLILVSDNNAFDFVIRYHEFLFKDLPVLFCGINNFDKVFLQENNMQKYMTGIVEQVDIEKNFELILNLHPNLKKLIIINDFSKTGQAIRRDLRSIIPKFKSRIKDIEYIDNMDMKDIKTKLKNAKKDTVILFVLLFKDKTGKFFTYKESLQEIKSVSKVPTYGLWDFYLDYGIVGGLLTSARAQGEAISQMALEVLGGKKIKDIPIIEKSPNRFMFDYNELSRFDIKIQNYLDEYKYTIVNRPFSFYREYRALVNGTGFVFIIFIILIVLMKRNIRSRQLVEKDLSNQLRFDKVLLDTLPNPIYYKNIDGRFLGCNIAFANLTNHKRKDVIGKTAFDFFPNDLAVKNTNIDKKLLKTLGSNTSELTLHLHDKGMRYFILNKAVYENIDGSVGGIVCIMDDITERIQQKQFLIQQSKLAEMGDMVAAIAHQWNEPLVELSAEVQDIELSFMLNELKDTQVKDFVKDSMIQIQYMSKTLSDFRNFLKPSTKKTLFGIRKSLDEIFEIIGKQVFYSNINLDIDYESENMNILLFGYENEFKQVLLNLINNAKNKIIEKNGMNGDKGTISINITCDDKYNSIEIIDDAGAIPQNIINLIFDPYFTTKKEGTGFGLYMAKLIIEDKMNGKISVKNDNEKVKFMIKLPNSQYDRLK